MSTVLRWLPKGVKNEPLDRPAARSLKGWRLIGAWIKAEHASLGAYWYVLRGLWMSLDSRNVFLPGRGIGREPNGKSGYPHETRCRFQGDAKPAEAF